MADIKYFDAPHPLSRVPAVEKEGVSLHDCTEGYYMAFVPSVSPSEFDGYCEVLRSCGFELVRESAMRDNIFRTYLDADGISAYVYRIGHSAEMRVVASEKPSLPPLEKEYARVCEPFAAQLNCGHDKLQLPEGMSYVVRNSDGSFIVIDGGYRRGYCAKMIYELMREQAPDPDDIVIAAWYFTHPHGDHAGAFIDFAEMYWDAPVRIESFLYNFCDEPSFCSNINTDLTARAREEMARFYPDAVRYFAQSGQSYYFGGTRVDILYSVQDYMPRVIPNEADATPKNPKRGDGNNLSVVARMEFDSGKSFFVMGDTTTICCDEMCARYGSDMKSDVVQMSHHGLSKPTPRAHNATVEIYDVIAPDVALLPCGLGRAPDRLEYEVNAHLAARVKKLYIAGDGLRIVPMG